MNNDLSFLEYELNNDPEIANLFILYLSFIHYILILLQSKRSCFYRKIKIKVLETETAFYSFFQ
jgi:hypothetical protein